MKLLTGFLAVIWAALMCMLVVQHANATTYPTATGTIRNAAVNGNTYTFDVYGQNTNAALPIEVKTFTFDFNINASAFSNPVVTLAKKYADSTYTTSKDTLSAVGLNIELDAPAVKAKHIYLSTTDELLFSVSLTIVNSATTANLSWNPITTTAFGPNGGSGKIVTTLNGSDASPLPITLKSFGGKMVDHHVLLQWTTLTETNNYGFYVEKSDDLSNFASIGFVPAQGPSSYSFTDYTAPFTNYRLRQVDLDGTSHISAVVSFTTADIASLPAPAKFELSQNYPNPFNPSTLIAFAVTKEGPVSLKVYDILGREVATLVNESRKPGQYTERFDGTRAATGIYMYVLRSQEGQRVSRMILSK